MAGHSSELAVEIRFDTNCHKSTYLATSRQKDPTELERALCFGGILFCFGGFRSFWRQMHRKRCPCPPWPHKKAGFWSVSALQLAWRHPARPF